MRVSPKKLSRSSIANGKSPIWVLIIFALVLFTAWSNSFLMKSIANNDMNTLPVSEDEIMFSDDQNENKNNEAESTMSSQSQQPPEPVDHIEWCAEKCRYIPDMCKKNLHRDKLSLPAPTCLNYSLTVPDDIYWTDFTENEGRGVYRERNLATNKLISWAAEQARERRAEQQYTITEDKVLKCEEAPTNYTQPMMFPEEFEFIVKLMSNLKPKTYLEWGCGASTSFYPLLASERVVAIDGYPPWCKLVQEEPRVHCMSQQEKRLQFHCPELLGANGEAVALKEVGKIPKQTSDADVASIMEIYVNMIDKTDMTSPIDLALVDGRFRIQCAIKLLPYFNEDSVLLMHDFWLRPQYHKVLTYYYVIGYARSVVALRKRPNENIGDESVQRNIYKTYMKRDHLAWDDIEM